MTYDRDATQDDRSPDAAENGGAAGSATAGVRASKNQLLAKAEEGAQSILVAQ
jgi:hypothetical protein